MRFAGRLLTLGFGVMILSGCQQPAEQLKDRLGHELYQEKTAEAIKTLKVMGQRKISLNGTFELHRCSRYRKVEAVKLLIGFGCDVNERDDDGCTPLHWAAESGSLPIVIDLLKHGAEVNAKNHTNWTPLDRATSYEQVEVVRPLLAAGATIETRLPGGSPVHLAASRGNRRILSELLIFPHEIDKKNEFDRTPLEEAAYLGRMDAVALLRANKAKMTLPAAVLLKEGRKRVGGQ
jgi:ankyrin repeat protein